MIKTCMYNILCIKWNSKHKLLKKNTQLYQLFDWYLLFCVVLYVQAPYSHYSSSSRAEMKKKEWSETFHVFVQLTIYVHNFAFKYNIQLNNINQLFN
jgi:hypothetical protein